MPINIQVNDSIIRVKKNGISLVDFEMKNSKNVKHKETLATDELEVFSTKSNENRDGRKKRNSGSVKDKKILNKKERSKRKLTKLEKRYKFLENTYYEYVQSKYDRSKPTFKTLHEKNDAKCLVSTLPQLTQEVLQLEQEVDAVLSFGNVRQHSDCNGNNVTEDSCEMFDYFMKLNTLKKRLLDELHLNLSKKSSTDASLQSATRSTNNDSISNQEFQETFSQSSSFFDDFQDVDHETTTDSISSRLDEDGKTINMLREELLMDLEKSSSEITLNCKIEHVDDQLDSLDFVHILSDIPKAVSLISKTPLLHSKKPPANLMCRHYKRLNIDFTVHELSAIYENDSDISNNQINILSWE